MKIGIIGAGNIGATVARLAVASGHEVMISNSRGPETLEALAWELGPEGTAGTAEEAAEFGDVVLEAIPFGKVSALPSEALAGKTVITASNYYPDRDGPIDLGGRTHSEVVAEHLNRSTIVKAFNTIWFQHLGTQGDTGKPAEERRAIFLAGDDAAAKAKVAEFVAGLGFGPVDTGSLRDGGLRQQPGSPIYNVDVTVKEATRLLDAQNQ